MKIVQTLEVQALYVLIRLLPFSNYPTNCSLSGHFIGIGLESGFNGHGLPGRKIVKKETMYSLGMIDNK